jgi:magnesium transporter
MKNNLLSEKLIYTGDSLAPTHLHLWYDRNTGVIR